MERGIEGGGDAKLQGLRWANPFFTKKKVSLRVRNFESSHLKVNDIDGNPIEIAAVVVWKVFETAEAIFEVDDYEHYVKVQSKAAMVSNLLVVLCGDRNTQPVINTGTIYQ